MTKEECEIETSKAIMEMRNQIAELKAELKAGKQEKQMAAAGEEIGTVRLYGKHGRYEIKGESRK